MHSTIMNLPEKTAINMIWLLLPISGWSTWFVISSLSHLFAVSVLCLWVGL
jgi:hypothetical protein